MTGLSTAEPFDMTGSMIRMIGGFLFCLGLFGGGVHLYRKFLAPTSLSTKRRMRVVERLPLSQKSALLLVSLDGKEFLVTSGPENVRLLTADSLTAKKHFDSSLDEAYAAGVEEQSCAA